MTAPISDDQAVTPELPGKARVVIIGAGLIGSSIACQMGRMGITEVVVLEKGRIGAQGATAHCVGGLRTQFSTAINVRYSLASRRIFRNFADEFGVSLDFSPDGYLFLADSSARWRTLQQTARLMAQLETPVELLTPGEVSRRWPFLQGAPGMGASYTREDGFYGPMEVLQAFVADARKRGVRFYEQTEVAGIKANGCQVTGVRTASGATIEAEAIVNAAGPWAGRVAALAGVDLPVQPLQRHLFLTGPCEPLPAVFPMIFNLDSGWYLKREGAGLLLGGPTAKKSFSDQMDYNAEEWTACESMRHVPLLDQTVIVRGWIGHYEVTPDHHAVIGAFPERGNFVCAAGFSGHGFQHSPVAGRLVAELIAQGQTRSEDIFPLRPTRFRENCLIDEPMTAFRAES